MAGRLLDVRTRIVALFTTPLMTRIAWHARRMAGKTDGRFFRSLMRALAAMLVVVSLIVWAAETDHGLADFGGAVYWSATTVLGQGDASWVQGPVGWAMGWLLGLFGVAIVAAMTGVLVGFMIDFLLKEGQGMGAAGFVDHVVVCGWNSTARDLVEELQQDEYDGEVVLIQDVESNPAGDGVYFVRGSGTNADDLRRAGIDHARAAVVCPPDASDQADMQSILTVLAIESLAPKVRTVVEVNNPRHVPHFERAHVDEVLVTSKLASRLLARTAMYPGLSALVTDFVSGGEGSELYRVELPDDCVGRTIDDVSAWLRREHAATLMAVSRGTRTFSNPETDYRLEVGDDLMVVAESLGRLQPLRPAHTPIG